MASNFAGLVHNLNSGNGETSKINIGKGVTIKLTNAPEGEKAVQAKNIVAIAEGKVDLHIEGEGVLIEAVNKPHDMPDAVPVEEKKPECDSIRAFFGGPTCEYDDVVDSKQEKPSYEYNMSNRRRGCFYILNQMKFNVPGVELPKRDGSLPDVENLEKTARILGFDTKDIKVFHNSTANEIAELVRKISNEDHSDCDCFVMAILTHGGDGDILYGHDKSFKIEEIIDPLKASYCKSLAGKPKLIFIQACRGEMLDHGDTVDSVAINTDNVPAVRKNPRGESKIPNESDFLVAYSTVPGYFSWRRTNGSWFIQALCRCMQEFGRHLELMQIMTRVNRMVAYEFASSHDDNKMHDKKQIPSIVTRLTHEVFFRDKNDPLQQQPQKRLEQNRRPTRPPPPLPEIDVAANREVDEENAKTTILGCIPRLRGPKKSKRK